MKPFTRHVCLTVKVVCVGHVIGLDEGYYSKCVSEITKMRELDDYVVFRYVESASKKDGGKILRPRIYEPEGK